MKILEIHLINKLDSKINPNIGNFLSKFFKIFTLSIVILGLIGISIGFGSVLVQIYDSNNNPLGAAGSLSTELILAVTLTWAIVTIISSLLWFYFSKWNV